MYCLAIVFLVTSILLSHVNASVRLAIAIDTAAIADEVQRTHLSQPASDIPTLHHNAEGIDAESYAEMRELWNDPVANECCGANRDGYCKDNTGGTPYCGHGCTWFSLNSNVKHSLRSISRSMQHFWLQLRWWLSKLSTTPKNRLRLDDS